MTITQQLILDSDPDSGEFTMSHYAAGKLIEFRRVGSDRCMAVEYVAWEATRMGASMRDLTGPDRPPILDRKPGPFAFVRSAEQRAQDADHLARDLDNERCDNTIWDRD